MAKLDGGRNEARSNAIWGRGGRRPGDSRTNALWGKGGRGSVLVLAFVLALAVPMAGTAKDKDPNKGGKAEASVYVPSSLLASAKANPDKVFKVVVLGAKGKKGSDVGGTVQSVSSSGKGKGLSKAFKHIPAASAELSGEQILRLVEKPKDIAAITLDAPVRSSDLGDTPPSNTAAPTVSGTATEGETLAAATGSWLGTAPLAYAYQWRRCDLTGLICSDVAGATAPSYALTAADVGSTMRVAVTASNGGGTASASSAAGSAVLAAPPVAPPAVLPANTALPAVSGTAREGETLQATSGAWTGTDPIAYTYQWRRCDTAGACTDIVNAVSGSYLLASADVGSTVKVVVRAANSAGSTSASSSATAAVQAVPRYSPPPQNGETWRNSTRISELWADAPQAPAIAIVDSGIDPSRTDVFGNRIVANVNFSSLTPGVTNDEQGHGTMVAGLAAGNSAEYPGVARNAPIVNIRVADSHGQSIVSDVISAADWILANKDQYNIRVANFSLRGTVRTSFRFDPLNVALRKLWFNGVVVVAAGGNHGTADAEVDMSYAPGNDPFIISVGAADDHQNTDPLDNTVAPWSAYGHQVDGFFKPDMSAPGRYLVMPAPESSTLWAQFSDRHVAPGYMWMSGTSFAAPIVAGAAAQILARYPDYSADDVKGILMLGANYIGGSGIAGGVGQIDAAYSASFGLPAGTLNPNENFYSYVDPVTGATLEFVKTDAVTGERYFDEASWATQVATDASWASASWASASWASASWASSNYASASWASASWASNVETAVATEVSGAEATKAESTKVE